MKLDYKLEWDHEHVSFTGFLNDKDLKPLGRILQEFTFYSDAYFILRVPYGEGEGIGKAIDRAYSMVESLYDISRTDMYQLPLR